LNVQKPNNRPERVGHEILHILGDVTTKYIDITHLGFITFTNCQVTPDLKLVKIYFSVLSPTKEIKIIERELNRLRKAFRKYLGQQLHIRNTPDITFIYDNSIEEANRINELFAKLNLDKDDL